MASEQHQRLVNNLALALEEKRGITITGIDVDGDEQFFDAKYQNLSPPSDHGGIPDLEGKDSSGITQLGEAEIDVNDSNVEQQLKIFSNRVMHGTNTPVPLHVIVPKGLREDMISKIREIGLGNKYDNGRISVWS